MPIKTDNSYLRDEQQSAASRLTNEIGEQVLGAFEADELVETLWTVALG